MTKSFNMAVIGYGLGGRVFHAPYISAVEGLTLAAIVSSRQEEIRKLYPEVVVLSDAEAVFADPDIDAVVISTPNDSHASLALRALEAGKHVVIDKPFAATAAEARVLAEKAKGRLLSVFHNRRWDGDFLTLRKLIANGVLGDVVYVESHFDLYRPVVSQRWREQPGPSSGAWFDLGSHLVDQILDLFGMPEALTADLDIVRPGGVATDYFRVLFRYEKMRAVLVGNYLAQSDIRWIVHGTKASFIKHGLDPQQGQLVAGGGLGDPGFGVDPNPGKLVLPDGTQIIPPTEKGNYSAFYEKFRDSMKGLIPVPVPPRDALKVMKILEAAEQSAQNHREFVVTDSPQHP